MVFGNNPFFETSLVLFESTGVLNAEEVQDFSHEIYPSITSNNVFIQTNLEVNCKVINHHGSVIKTEQVDGKKLVSLDNLSAGLYFIQLQSGNSSITERIIKVD